MENKRIIKPFFIFTFLWAWFFALMTLIPICSFAKGAPHCAIEKFQKYQMQYCYYRGEGPLLVLEAPLGSDLTIWPKPFINKLNQFAAVFVYNRTGVEKSNFYQKEVTNPITAKSTAIHLHELLGRFDTHKPIVVIGHSIGGLYAQFFTRNYSNNIAGLVLIDSSSSFEPKVNSPFQTKAVLEKGSIAYLENEGFNQSMDQVRASPIDLKIPLLIITAITAKDSASLSPIERQWDRLQKGMLEQSNRGEQIIAYASGHYVYIDKPDLVVEAIHHFIQKNVK